MSSNQVQTRTKDRVLTDRVYESPVDEYQLSFRRRVAVIGVAVILLLAIVALT